MLTDQEKIKKFEEIQKWLWSAAVGGNVRQAALSAALIRGLKIESPEGDDPDSAKFISGG